MVQQMVDFNSEERTIHELYKEAQILALADRPPLLAFRWWIKQLSAAINQLPEQDCEAIGEPQSDDERDSNSDPDLRAVLIVNEGIRRALLGFDNWRFSVREHQTTHWTSCYDDRCFIHIWHKDNAEYFPKKQSRESRSGLPRRGERSERWHRSYQPGPEEKQHFEEAEGLEHGISIRWTQCAVGYCEWHRESKIAGRH